MEQRVFVHWYGVGDCKHGAELVKGADVRL